MDEKMLDLLNNLEEKLICHVCKNKCKNAVRIRTCDHYFCEKCLKINKNSHACPHCKSYYEVSDIEYNNLARTTEHLLKKIRNILEDESEDETDTVLSDLINIEKSAGNNTKKSKKKFESCTFTFDKKIYHINFVDSLTGKINPKGETPLHLACKKKKLDTVMKLIKDKALDINIKDHAGWAPIHEAVQSQNLEIIEFLLKSGCLIDIPGLDHTTPLHQAATLENTDIIKLLLKYGADKNVVDYNGMKPIDSTKNQAVKDILTHKELTRGQTSTYEVFLTNKPILYCHSIDEIYKDKLKSSKNIIVEDKVDIKKKPTHFVIKKTHKISFKILQSILLGIQFLTQESVDDFVKGNYFIDIPSHQFVTNNEHLNAGIKKAMISALLKLPALFAGLNFFIENHNKPVGVYNLKVDKDYLGKLISFGGGRVLIRPPALRTCEREFTHPYFAKQDSGTYRCSNFIIYENDKPPELKYNMPELQHKSSKWLIECIINYEIKD